MSKHTKGPWHLNEHGKVVSPDGRTVPVGGFSLAMYSSPEVIANDTLLSCAPALLAAAESIQDAGFESGSDGWGVLHITHEDWEALCDAIAKAKGESA